jgi:hypothetical protein
VRDETYAALTPLARGLWVSYLPKPLHCAGCGIETDAYHALGLPDGAVVCRVVCGMRWWRWAHESRGQLGPSQNWPIRVGRVET